MMSADEVAMSGISSKLLEVQRVCNDAGDALPTKLVEAIRVTCEGAE